MEVPCTNVLPFQCLVEGFHMDSKKHKELTAMPNSLILDNLRRIDQEGVPVIVRILICPGCNDSDTNVQRTMRFVVALRSVKQVALLPYHNLGVRKYELLGRKYPGQNIRPRDQCRMERLRAIGESEGLRVNIGG
jgi:pyruvate formate lyase activating enzyme